MNESNDGRNPNIPESAYRNVGGPLGKVPMGYFHMKLLYFYTHGVWPDEDTRPKWRLSCFEPPEKLR